MRRKNPATKSAKKSGFSKKKKKREQSVLPKSDPKKYQAGVFGDFAQNVLSFDQGIWQRAMLEDFLQVLRNFGFREFGAFSLAP